MKKLFAVLATSAAVIAFSPAASHADPKGGTFTLDCGDDGTYEIVTGNGNGEFTPAMDVNSTTTFVPTSFDGFHFLATAPDGTVLAEDNDDSVVFKGKGNPSDRSPRPKVSCTFGATEVLTEEVDGFPAGTTLTFGGDVTGYFSPSK